MTELNSRIITTNNQQKNNIIINPNHYNPDVNDDDLSSLSSNEEMTMSEDEDVHPCGHGGYDHSTLCHSSNLLISSSVMNTPTLTGAVGTSAMTASMSTPQKQQSTSAGLFMAIDDIIKETLSPSSTSMALAAACTSSESGFKPHSPAFSSSARPTPGRNTQQPYRNPITLVEEYSSSSLSSYTNSSLSNENIFSLIKDIEDTMNLFSFENGLPVYPTTSSSSLENEIKEKEKDGEHHVQQPNQLQSPIMERPGRKLSISASSLPVSLVMVSPNNSVPPVSMSASAPSLPQTCVSSSSSSSSSSSTQPTKSNEKSVSSTTTLTNQQQQPCIDINNSNISVEPSTTNSSQTLPPLSQSTPAISQSTKSSNNVKSKLFNKFRSSKRSKDDSEVFVSSPDSSSIPKSTSSANFSISTSSSSSSISDLDNDQTKDTLPPLSSKEKKDRRKWKLKRNGKKKEKEIKESKKDKKEKEKEKEKEKAKEQPVKINTFGSNNSRHSNETTPSKDTSNEQQQQQQPQDENKNNSDDQSSSQQQPTNSSNGNSGGGGEDNDRNRRNGGGDQNSDSKDSGDSSIEQSESRKNSTSSETSPNASSTPNNNNNTTTSTTSTTTTTTSSIPAPIEYTSPILSSSVPVSSNPLSFYSLTDASGADGWNKLGNSFSGTSLLEDAVEEEAPRGGRGRSNAFYMKQPPVIINGEVKMPTPPPVQSPMTPFGGLSNVLPKDSSSALSKPTGLLSKFRKGHGRTKTLSKVVKHHSARFVVGFADTIGRRPHMEDETVIYGTYRGRVDEDYFALFDGHGGAEAAEYAAAEMHRTLADRLKRDSGNPVRALKEAFTTVHGAIEKSGMRGGTTAVVALFLGKKGYIANVGDSRAVLCRDGVAVRVSVDHKPNVPREEERIKALGGTVVTTVNAAGITTSRVNGQLAVSRALGDSILSPFVSCEPDIHGPINLETHIKNQFMIIACDGIWDVISDEEAVSIVAPIADPEKACMKLRDQAFTRGSTDNISVLVIRFPPFQD